MRFGEILFKKKIVTKQGIENALAHQKSTGHRLGHSLIELRQITEKQSIETLREQGKKVMDLSETVISQEIYKHLPLDYCRKNTCVPIQLIKDHLIVALPDPENKTLLKDIQFLSNKKIEPVLAIESQIEKLLLISKTPTSARSSTPDYKTSQKDAPALLDKLIFDSILMSASDLHLESEKTGWQVRQRIDGLLHPGHKIPDIKISEIVSAVKVRCGLDITEKRLPQDGSFSVRTSEHDIDIRVSIIPGRWGESIVLRFLRKDQAGMTIDSLGLLPEQEKELREAVNATHGIILATGPTGSGKSTTLYSLLRLVDRSSRKILTVEDPIEYELDNVQQVEVKPEIGLTFARTLKHFLRHDPDIIMIGEIRDAETAEIAVRAAMTGHLVLSTLHTNDAISTINRLRDLGLPDYLLFDTLKLVMAQRLIRTWDKTSNRYQGRTAVFETLPINEIARDALLLGNIKEAKPLLVKNGFKTMYEAAKEKVKTGITMKDEIVRVLGKE